MKQRRNWQGKNGIIWLLLAILIISVTLYVFTSSSSDNHQEPTKKIRIVSLMPSLTQSIYYLGAQDQIVGCTNYCVEARADSIEVVSSVIKPNVEKIVSLKPDIILVSGLIAEKDIETFEKFGIHVERFASPKSFDEVCSEFIRIGDLVGEHQKASDIVTRSRERVHSIQESVDSLSRPKIFIQIGASPIHTVISDTFMDDYITFCGGVNIAAGLSNGAVGREFVVTQNPDVIFIVTMGIAGEEEADRWREFKQMSASVNNKIFIISSDIACQPTPFTFIETLELMNGMINN